VSLSHGIPSSDTFRRVLERLSPKLLGEVLEQDGKSLLDFASTAQYALTAKNLGEHRLIPKGMMVFIY
jgi:hypothetical protein